MQITLVTGTRPNLVKAAPLIREFKKQNINFRFVHTGQHYNQNMFQSFLDDLELPHPDNNFNIAHPHNITSTSKISKMLIRFYDDCHIYNPDLIMVLGDVDSTLAAALVANKMKIPLAHVEAGERCGDRSMPEEMNRILVDQMADYHFCASEQGYNNLIRENIGMPYIVGNTMIDQIKHVLSKEEDYAIRSGDYAVFTLHRQENVDDPTRLKNFANILQAASQRIQVIFPIHPRTEKMIKHFKLDKDFGEDEMPNVVFTDPMSYSEFIITMEHSKFVMTDSGGIQVEASFLKKPYLTLREGTEWNYTLNQGYNKLVGFDKELILYYIRQIFKDDSQFKCYTKAFENILNLNASEEIVNIIKRNFK